MIIDLYQKKCDNTDVKFTEFTESPNQIIFFGSLNQVVFGSGISSNDCITYLVGTPNSDTTILYD